jgi:cell division protein FtsB
LKTLDISIARNEETAKKQEVVDLESQKANLERKVEGLCSEDFVMQQARNWLKMAKSGEYVYIFREN